MWITNNSKTIKRCRKMMKRWLKSFLVMGAVLGVWVLLVVGQAQATLINATGISDPDNDSAAYFSALSGEEIFLLDKDEFNDPPVGTTDSEGHLEVRITNAEFPGEAFISWDLSGTGLQARWVAVKDGNANGSGIYWVRYEVHADQFVTGSGTVSTALNGQGAISHIALYGTRGTSVPDAGIMYLLGTGLVVLGGLGRRRSRA
jgi:hypothetical protein